MADKKGKPLSKRTKAEILEFLKNELSQLEKNLSSHHESLKEIETTKQELRDLYKNHGKRLSEIDRRIEEGGSIVELIKTFEDKVKEYKGDGRSIFRFFIGSIVVVISMAIACAFIVLADPFCSDPFCFKTTDGDLPLSFYLLSITIFGFAAWLLLFLSKEKGESKKLEEIYKHKEVMARAFIGYRKILTEIPVDQEDRNSLDDFRRSLLDAIKQNPSDSIKSRSDHPASYVLPFKTIDKIIYKIIKELPVNKEYRDFLLDLMRSLSEVIKQTSKKRKGSSGSKK